jgi:hypothetical protein
MKKILYLIRYIKLLKKNKSILTNSRINGNPNPLGIQFDWIYRLYTVLNLPIAEEESKDDIKKYGYYYVDEMVKTHISEIQNFLFELGILEYVVLDIDSIQQIDDYNIMIVLKFKYINLKGWAKFLRFLLFAIIIGGFISLVIFI